MLCGSPWVSPWVYTYCHCGVPRSYGSADSGAVLTALGLHSINSSCHSFWAGVGVGGCCILPPYLKSQRMTLLSPHPQGQLLGTIGSGALSCDPCDAQFGSDHRTIFGQLEVGRGSGGVGRRYTVYTSAPARLMG